MSAATDGNHGSSPSRREHLRSAGWVPDADRTVTLSGSSTPARDRARQPALSIPDTVAPNRRTTRRSRTYKPTRKEAEALDRARKDSPWGAVIAVTRLAGGQGTTTVAALVGQALALSGLGASFVVSASPDGGELNRAMSVEQPGSVVDFIATSNNSPRGMAKVSLTDSHAVHVMASPADPTRGFDTSQLRTALLGLRGSASWAGQTCTVVDLPADWSGDATRDVIDVATHVVVAADRSATGLRRAETAVDALLRQAPDRPVVVAVVDTGRRGKPLRAELTRLRAVASDVVEFGHDDAIAGGDLTWSALEADTRISALTLATCLPPTPEGDHRV